MSTPLEQHFTGQQVAEAWGVDYLTVYRMFRDEPGVLRLSVRRDPASKRRRESLRIPESTLTRVYEQQCSGLKAKVQLRRRGVQ